MKNYYEILGVGKNASGREIRSAYIEKIKMIHPDTTSVFNGNKSVNDLIEAYSTLRDKNRRARYDLVLEKETTFFATADHFYPDTMKQELIGEKTYKRMMIILWVVMGFIVALLVTTLYDLNTAEEQTIDGGNNPFKEDFTPPKNIPDSNGAAPKEIFHVREI